MQEVFHGRLMSVELKPQPTSTPLGSAGTLNNACVAGKDKFVQPIAKRCAEIAHKSERCYDGPLVILKRKYLPVTHGCNCLVPEEKNPNTMVTFFKKQEIKFRAQSVITFYTFIQWLNPNAKQK